MKIIRVYPYRSKWVINEHGEAFPKEFVEHIEEELKREGRRIGRNLLGNHIVVIIP